MSHFTVLAIVPDKIMKKEERYIHEFIDLNMSRYDENKVVKPYNRECYCKKFLADSKAREEAGKSVGTIDSFRDIFKVKEEEIKKKYGIDKVENWDEWIKNEDNKKIWKQSREEEDDTWKELIKPFIELEGKLKEEYLKKLKPDLRCTDCGGTGIEKGVRYNPDSQWDWYRIGGRWDGFLTDNEQNTENGFNFDDKHETLKNNMIKIKDLIKKIKQKKEKDEYSTYAILTKDGEWASKGKMGWWGMSSDDKEDWPETYLKVLRACDLEDWGIVLDCHI